MIVAVVGSRDIPDDMVMQCKRALWAVLQWFAPDVTGFVSGGAAGVDTWAECAANALDKPIEIIRPRYGKFHPRAAPLIRNNHIIKAADFIIAFQINESRGTGNAIYKAKIKGIPGLVFDGTTWVSLHFNQERTT